MSELEDLIASLPPMPPRWEARASATGLDDLRRVLPPVEAPDPIARFAGIPIIVDPIIPEHFVALVGPETPWDPADPLKPTREIRFIDLRNVAGARS